MASEQLNSSELERYSRQIMLDTIGYEGQIKLKTSKACVIGVGGLGVPIVVRLATMGIGYLKIVDRDVVSLSDLHRQYLYDGHMIGRAKVEVAAEKLEKLNPNISVEPLPESITSYNISKIIKGCDVVLDGLDAIEARYLVNSACVEEKIPYIYGGAIQTIGNVTTIVPRKTPCIECFSPGLRDAWAPKCSIVGVSPPILDIVAAIEVSEAVRIITGSKPKLAGKLLFIDLENLGFDLLEIKRNERCPVCGENAAPRPLESRTVEEECARDGKRTFFLNPRKPLDVDLELLNQKIISNGVKVELNGRLYTTLRYKGNLVTIMKSGIIIIQSVDKRETSSKLIEDISQFIAECKVGIPEDAYTRITKTTPETKE